MSEQPQQDDQAAPEPVPVRTVGGPQGDPPKRGLRTPEDWLEVLRRPRY